MITLYHSPLTRSHLIRFALEELELPHQIIEVNVAQGAHKAPDYLKINPMGQLPTLRDGDRLVREAAAIALHLADRAPEKGLAPMPGSLERAAYYQWVVFAVASELFALAKIAMHTRILPEALRAPATAAEGLAQWKDVAAAIELQLAEARSAHGGHQLAEARSAQFLLGDTFSMADVVVGGSLWLADWLGVLSPHPELVAYYGRVSDRPAFQRAFADAVVQ